MYAHKEEKMNSYNILRITKYPMIPVNAKYELRQHSVNRVCELPLDIVPWILHVTMGFPGGSDSKESTWNAGDLYSIPGLGRLPGEESDYQLRYIL